MKHCDFKPFVRLGPNVVSIAMFSAWILQLSPTG